MVSVTADSARRRAERLFDELNSQYVGRWWGDALTSANCLEELRESKVSLPLTERRLQFSPREAEVLRLVAGGHRDKEIARVLGIAPSTVRTHLENVFEKCGQRSRAAAVASWLGSEAS